MPRVKLNTDVMVGRRLHKKGSVVDLDEDRARDAVARKDGVLVPDETRTAVSPLPSEARKAVKLGG